MTYLRYMSKMAPYVAWRGHVTTRRRCQPSTTNSEPSGKLFSLGTIESSNVASMAFIDFLIDTLSHNDGARGASFYFKSWKTQN